MLEKAEWVKINDSCQVLVDEDQKILAAVFTSYDDDGDENKIWDVEIENENFGSYVSLISAQMAVQKAIAEWEDAQRTAEEKRKSRKRKKAVSRVSNGE